MFGVRYRYVFVVLLAIYSYLNILFTEGDRLFGFELNNFAFFGILFSMTLLIWEGNRLTEGQRERYHYKSGLHPLIIQFLLSLVVVAGVSACSVFALLLLLDEPMATVMLHMKLSLGFAFRINLFLQCVNAIVFYIYQLKKSQLEAEQFKKESAEAKFEVLRSQINPHFLFNSFNVLSTLVYKDADTSARFIEQLSDVYRYLLNNQDNKVVRLKKELEFINAYIYLLKIRFGDNLHVENNIPEEKKDTFIAPSTLQLLIENAIKHNVVSKQNPLKISLYSSNGHLIVENNLQPKRVKEASTNVGLENIKNRYKFLGGKDTVVINSNGVFKVEVPLLEMDTI